LFVKFHVCVEIGEWTGAWGDNSAERENNKAEIKAAFSVSNAEAEDIESTANDGAFFMTFKVCWC
jgi:hypothetical protein